MTLDAKHLVRQWEEIASNRGTWENSWQNIADHILGRREFTSDTIEGGRRRMQTIYDTTALFSVSALAGGLHSLLTNPAAEWFHLKPEDDRMLQDRSIAEWFEDAEMMMYNALNRPEARFASQIHETYIDLVSFGTGGFSVQDVPGIGPMYSSRPLSELYVSENMYGVVDTVFRKFKFSARQAVEAWGKKAPESAHKAIANNRAEEKKDYLHMVRPSISPLPLPFDPRGFPWVSVFINIEHTNIIDTGGFHEMPYMLPRWEKDSGETYGRGPGFTALADAKMLNEMNKTIMQAGQQTVRPPTMTEDDGVSQIDWRPGANNVVRPGGFLNPPIQPIQSGARLDWGAELLADKRQQVQRAFHWELLQLIRDPRMTATQVIEISNNIQRLLSPILGRFHSELLEPLIERIFGILMRSGVFLQPPAALSGVPVRVEYVSPVARAQREQDARAIVELFTVGANLAQIDPDVNLVTNYEEGMRLIADAKGVPIKVLRSRDEVEELKEGQRELAAQQEAQETAANAAKLLPALSEAAGGTA
jgi:hypothetical protein